MATVANIGRPRKWTKAKCKACAEGYRTRNEWVKGHFGSYIAAWRYGWLEHCTSHMRLTAFGTDNNAVYVYRINWGSITNLYKIGITSIRRNTGRIEDTLKSLSRYEIGEDIRLPAHAADVHMYHVEDARAVEKLMLERGVPLPSNVYDGPGWTEMRFLTNGELRDCLTIMQLATDESPVFLSKVEL